MKVRFNTYNGILAWDHCDFCSGSKFEVAKFTILHNGQKLIRKLCPACARHLNEFGDDFERLR